MLAFVSLVALLFSIASAGALPGRVLDIDGKPLSASSRYHVMPVRKDTFGGLYSSSYNFTSCPLYIMQADTTLIDGIGATFTPVDGSKSIRLSTDLNVEFFESNACAESPIWTMAPPNKVGRRYVKFGGVVGSPGPATVNNWFRIEQDGANYKLVFCPSVCSTCKAGCGNLGVHQEGDHRWLVLGGRSFAVKFKKNV